MMNRLDELKNDYDRYIEPFNNIINKDLKEFTDSLKKRYSRYNYRLNRKVYKQ